MLVQELNNNAVEKLQTDLKACSLINNKEEQFKPKCVGRCVIELGDINRHNVMVSFYKSLLSLINKVFKEWIKNSKIFDFKRFLFGDSNFQNLFTLLFRLNKILISHFFFLLNLV